MIADREVTDDAGAIVAGTQPLRAHAFYFREGFFITSFNFKKSIT